mmetsp:Transcript_23205/g.59116  ORF Transcript_23205/g.59116 Transcript_23205/m.59116 type:complete len:214 (-) Transcript_23205:12-653(-)
MRRCRGRNSSCRHSTCRRHSRHRSSSGHNSSGRGSGRRTRQGCRPNHGRRTSRRTRLRSSRRSSSRRNGGDSRYHLALFIKSGPLAGLRGIQKCASVFQCRHSLRDPAGADGVDTNGGVACEKRADRCHQQQDGHHFSSTATSARVPKLRSRGLLMTSDKCCPGRLLRVFDRGCERRISEARIIGSRPRWHHGGDEGPGDARQRWHAWEEGTA